MKTLNRDRSALLAAALTLAACNAGTQSTDPNISSRIGTLAIRAHHGSSGFQRYGKSWMEPNAKSHRLLYVSDSNNSIVQVYNYPEGTQKPPAGTLTGLNHPHGMCIDHSHNIYITNQEGFSVFKYAAGATQPSATYSLGTELPGGCSVDPTTGNLAVSSGIGSHRQYGAVTICTGPAHCRTFQHPASLVNPAFISYTDSGDLYVNGFTAIDFGMAYLAKGSRAWQVVNYSGPKGAPGGVQWVGTHLVMSLETEYPALLHLCSVSGPNVDCSGKAVELDKITQMEQFFVLQNNRAVVAADVYNDAVDTWAYPAGGNPKPKRHITPSESYPLLVGTAVLSPQQ